MRPSGGGYWVLPDGQGGELTDVGDLGCRECPTRGLPSAMRRQAVLDQFAIFDEIVISHRVTRCTSGMVHLLVPSLTISGPRDR